MANEVPIRASDFNPETRNISNSEVTTFLNCERMYDFTFIDNLAPRETSRPLTRGTLGHEAFDRYIKARLNGSSHEKAIAYARTAFEDAIKEGVSIDIVMETEHLWTRYMDHHRGWPQWKLLGSEERVDLQLTDTIKIAIRYDLMVEEIATGRVGMGDWKFTYDFWSDDDHYLNGQMPKYIAVMRLNNRRVDFGFIEQVRTRKITAPDKLRDPKNLWRRTEYNPTQAKLKSMLNQHVRASLRIEQHRAQPPEVRKANSLPVLNKHGACKYCAFTSLCNSMNEGVDDLEIAKRVHFTTNEYAEGYNPTLADIKDEL